MTTPFLTIAIPTMRRWWFLKDSLPLMLEREEVGEIVVCDETGEDADMIEKHILCKQNKKLRVIRNETRLGIYHNKRKALSLATYPLVAVLDSDNVFPDSWFDVLSDAIQQKGTNIVYGSPSFNSINTSTGKAWKPCKSFADLQLDATSWNTIFHKQFWNHLLNDGNWVVPKDAIRCLPETIPAAYKEGATYCDALYMLRCFIEGGYSIWYVPELEYNHLVHEGSSWLTREAPSNRAIQTTKWTL